MKIGITFGAFDLLHPGHIVMFQECKTVCDYLIVGLQTDPSIDRPQKNKPIQDLEERKIMLNAVRYVDKIFVYETEEELYGVLKSLKNIVDVRIIGEDWRNKKFTGWDLDIPIYYNSRKHSWSSSELKQRIREVK